MKQTNPKKTLKTYSSNSGICEEKNKKDWFVLKGTMKQFKSFSALITDTCLLILQEDHAQRLSKNMYASVKNCFGIWDSVL